MEIPIHFGERVKGKITIEHSKTVQQHVELVILGCIAGTGTAVLVDNTRRVWLFNAPHTVDHYLRRHHDKEH